MAAKSRVLAIVRTAGAVNDDGGRIAAMARGDGILRSSMLTEWPRPHKQPVSNELRAFAFAGPDAMEVPEKLRIIFHLLAFLFRH